MSDIFESSLRLKKSIEKVAKEVIERDTRSCLRVYKAVVITPPYVDENLGNVCQVKMIGDDTVLTLPYATCANNIVAGDRVWVQTTYNSFKNAIVWIKTDMRTEPTEPPKHYGARWDKVQAQMTRLYDAEDFPTDTSNFGHFGSVNPNYNNPFDDIYPWSEIKLCNIDIDLYMNLTEGQSITKSVVAWEGDPDFSYDHPNGVWRYRPAFYGKSWEDETYRYFDVCESNLGGYIYYPEDIAGRWQGVEKQLSINGQEQPCLIPTSGIPAGRGYGGIDLHQFAKNYGASIDSIYTLDADILLMIVEYSTMNSQVAIGYGITLLYYVPNSTISEGFTNTNVITLPASSWKNYCIPGAVIAIENSVESNSAETFYVISAELDSSDSANLIVTLNAPATATTSQYISVQGSINKDDTEIGSKSGYFGKNGYSNAYYRGIVMFGNGLFYTLGAYKQGSTQHIWITSSNEQANQYDALNTSVHIDTGLVIPTGNGYIDALGLPSDNMLSIPPFCTARGGTYQNPVGDYLYNSDASTTNTVLYIGGTQTSGGAGGVFTQFWIYTRNSQAWYCSARPRLMPVSSGG